LQLLNTTCGSAYEFRPEFIFKVLPRGIIPHLPRRTPTSRQPLKGFRELVCTSGKRTHISVIFA
jgi:hypothetical protein